LPPQLLAIATLAAPDASSTEYALCAYQAEEKALLVHPVTNEIETWARLEGVVPPDGTSVSAAIRLRSSSHGPVEFALFGTVAGASFEDTAKARTRIKWLRLAPGEQSAILWPTAAGDKPRTLWVGTRMGDDGPNWSAHAIFSDIRIKD
jgi:hypothetical protein